MSGVVGAEEAANGSEVRLPSREGGWLDIDSRSWGNKESTAGDIGILGGNGGEPSWSLCMDGHSPGDGMIKDGTLRGSTFKPSAFSGEADRVLPARGNMPGVMS